MTKKELKNLIKRMNNQPSPIVINKKNIPNNGHKQSGVVTKSLNKLR